LSSWRLDTCCDGPYRKGKSFWAEDRSWTEMKT
jgi:hypothetical protein